MQITTIGSLSVMVQNDAEIHVCLQAVVEEQNGIGQNPTVGKNLSNP